ncbi:LOW QUALITY PROTEIN: hypothetical protein BT93_L1601 [Corymbia citriodora subsp. variegata]|uniref:Leucine-rich repeat-containing N-terminal plant-type domain-containing protein n=1 Tax=Corymbia citriodora subsp. variegata TaxID=360336 RepID=A0A8T0CR60_CORYI|nr:LOW QUALITY PROTEIN: hypothetical protein BT93_L1601 [Corymbia citriodora subsp. variegata]
MATDRVRKVTYEDYKSDKFPKSLVFTEARTLLKWKSTLGNHSLSSLSSWTSSPRNATGSNSTMSPCAWYGISCNPAGSVIRINLTSAGVEGMLDEFPFSSLSHLMYVDLSVNNLSGHIPLEISLLSNLTYLDLSINRFLGKILPEIGYLMKLEVLHLFSDGLIGSIPQEIGQLHLLVVLYSNQLNGPIPPSLVNLSKLATLYVYNNSLSGSIPPEIGNMTNLEVLHMNSNNLTGPIPSTLGNLTKLRELYLFSNKLTGCILLELGNLNLLSTLGLYNNSLTSSIPPTLGNLTNLLYLFLRENQLSGSIPASFGDLLNLTMLDLGGNQLSGTIPQTFSSSLKTVVLGQNQFKGTLPQSLVNCKNLEVLDFSNNKIEDKFPAWLGKLPNLKVLSLKSNHFKGLLDFPKVDHLFPKLHILDLSNNNFSGPLPANLIGKLQGMMNGQNVQGPQDKPLYGGQTLYGVNVTMVMKGREVQLVRILTIFTAIDLSLNSFQGNIPNVIGNLHSLVGLNLSHNNLESSIRSTLGNLTLLDWLDLSSNKLSGRVPRELGDLSFLGCFNLSENQLTGRIPQDKHLSTFTSDSFRGNLGLCGTPLQNTCPGDAQPTLSPPRSFFLEESTREPHSGFDRKAVGLGYASGIVIGISIAYILYEIRRPKWLVAKVRSMERRAKLMKKPKRKAIRFHGG